jgi:dTDP-4-dehydrorhamnose reductase
MNNTDLLVIGGSGFVGAHIVKLAANQGCNVAYTYARHKIPLPARAYQVRIEQRQALKACLADTQPGIIIYCAKPETLAPGATQRAINVHGVRRVLASLNYDADSLFVYLSSNAVFSGQHGPYRENDVPDPGARQDAYRVYAITKYEGEKVALEDWPNSIVARTATVNGRDVHGELNPRLKTPVERLLAGHSLARFCDRYISPTLVHNLAQALLEVIKPGFTYRGILHLAGSQRVTDYAYGRYLAQRLGVDEGLITPEHMAHSPSSADGPRDSSLDTTFTSSLLNTRLLPVQEQLAATF